VLPVASDAIGDYFNDPGFRENFQVWLNALWVNKNKRMKAWMDGWQI
jgi:hypothetical protein